VMNRLELKKALLKATHCNVQHDGWPCGTCFFAMSEELTNQDWQAVLLKRGDSKRKDLHNLPKDIEKSLEKTLAIAQGEITKNKEVK